MDAAETHGLLQQPEQERLKTLLSTLAEKLLAAHSGKMAG
jgi:hypothetical protein